MTTAKPIKAWHFINADRRLGYGDGRKVIKGRTYKYKGKEPIELCKRGMHASIKPLDALKYAKSNIICRVELSGQIIKGDDKCVASERKVIQVFDAEKVLRKFACLCALDGLPENAPDIVVKYLKTQDESIRMEADRAANRAADRAACAACAAYLAAYLAADRAAYWAAYLAARNDMVKKQNRRLSAMLRREMEKC